MMVFPVDPAANPTYANDFNPPKHQGIDIFAPKGTEVRAVEDGSVMLASEKRGGTVAYLKTTSGTYFYGHLDDFVGISPRWVKAGEVIGHVGNTGNAVHTSPHVHFQHSAGDGPINPFPELQAIVKAPAKRCKIPTFKTDDVILIALGIYLLTRKRKRKA